MKVFEYQKLRVGEDGFTKKHLAALVKFNEKNGNKYFTPIYNGVQFGSYVGVVQIGGFTIEILPKADRDTSYSKENKNLWQGVLLNMLRVCKVIQVDNVSEAALKKKYNSILELYYEIFLNEVEHLVKKGLIKKYRRIKNNQLALKGKLLFSRDVQKNLVHKERCYCEHQVYDKNHLIHQILYQALRILDDVVSHSLHDKVKRLLFEFNAFTCSEFNANHFEKLKLDRKSKPYQKSLDIARMLILNYSPNLNSGQDHMLTLLFDMNKLWEEYIYRVLQRHSDNSHYHISAQETQSFWEHKSIRPDIVVTNNHNQEKIIIDTKWKIVDNSNPSDDDLKQMFTYNLHWGASKSILLYPQIEQQDTAFGRYRHEPYRNLGEEWKSVKNTCKISFVSLIENGEIRKSQDLFYSIVNKFE